MRDVPLSTQEAVNPMSRSKYRLPILLQFSAVVLAATPSYAASWKTNVAYGGSGTTMDLYVPDKAGTPTGIVVAIHYCSGSAAGVHSWFQTLADQYGFIIIAPDAVGNCWDSSPGRTGEKAAIVKMVEYTLSQYKVDKTKVFAAGASSGACMTNTLMGVYPDVFAAGSVLAGVPVGAWPSGNTSCSGVCKATPPTKSAAGWGDIVRNAYSFTGSRPRLQLFHGTVDEYLDYAFLAEEVKQWSNVLGIADTGTTENDKPSSGWTRTNYKDGSGNTVLEVNSGKGQPHDLTGKGLFPDVIRFFGLDKTAPSAGGASSTGGSSSTGGKSSSISGGASSTGGKTSATGNGGTSSVPVATVPVVSGGSVSVGSTVGNGGGVSNGGTSSIAVVSSALGGATNRVVSGTSSLGGAFVQGTNGAAIVGGAASAATTGGNSVSGSSGSDDEGGCSITATRTTRAGGAAFMTFAAVLGGVMLRRRRRTI
jgi:poly(hydroxyalkanoate) depolymerase family esterase